MINDTLAEILDIHPIEVIDSSGTQTVLPPDGVEEDVDFDFVRANHYLLAQQASEAIQTALKVVRQSEDPKAIASMSKLLKATSDINRQLLLLNKDRAETKTAKNVPQTGQAPQSVTHVQQQVVFTGTSSELNKMIKDEDGDED